MIRFIREDQLGVEFRHASAFGSELAIAAPFWGEGAASLLGLAANSSLKILCCFDSPACNPRSLLELLDLGAVVRSHKRLHAKLYLTSQTVIVGSSNPSRWGLTQEGELEVGSVEGNIVTDDSEVVLATWKLFGELWNDKRETSRVTRKMIEQEIEQRALDPAPIIPRSIRARTLLDACREAPELFGDVVVGAYKFDLDEGGKLELLTLQKRAVQPNSDKDVGDFRNAWAYQFEEGPPAGSWVIDLDYRGRTPRIHGASQVPNPALRMTVEGENDLTPTIRGVTKVAGARGKFPIRRKDRDELAAIAQRLLREKPFCTLPEVVAMIDEAACLEAESPDRTDDVELGPELDRRRAFAAEYEMLARQLLPNLKLKDSSFGQQAKTMSFGKVDLALLRGLWPRHELGWQSSSSYVNVQIPGAVGRLDVVRASRILEKTGFTADSASGSLAIRALTVPLDPTRPLAIQRSAAKHALKELKNIMDWVTRNERKLATLVQVHNE